MITTAESERGFFFVRAQGKEQNSTLRYTDTVVYRSIERDSRVLKPTKKKEKNEKEKTAESYADAASVDVLESSDLTFDVDRQSHRKAIISTTKESISTMILFWSYHRLVENSVMEVELVWSGENEKRKRKGEEKNNEFDSSAVANEKYVAWNKEKNQVDRRQCCERKNWHGRMTN